jgi:hypothetical protein
MLAILGRGSRVPEEELDRLGYRERKVLGWKGDLEKGDGDRGAQRLLNRVMIFIL